MVSSLLTLHLEKASSRLGGPTAGWVDQQQVAFIIVSIFFVYFGSFECHGEGGIFLSKFECKPSVALFPNHIRLEGTGLLLAFRWKLGCGHFGPF